MGGREHEYNREQQSQDAENKRQSGELAKGEEQKLPSGDAQKETTPSEVRTRRKSPFLEALVEMNMRQYLQGLDVDSLLPDLIPKLVAHWTVLIKSGDFTEEEIKEREEQLAQQWGLKEPLPYMDIEEARALADESHTVDRLVAKEAIKNMSRDQIERVLKPKTDIEIAREQWQDEGTIDVEVPQDGRKETITYKVPSRRDKHAIKPSTFLEAMTNSVVFQAQAKHLQAENQVLTERDEAKREQDRQRMARQREEDREAYNAQRRQYMREWRARKKQQAQSQQVQEPKRNKS